MYDDEIATLAQRVAAAHTVDLLGGKADDDAIGAFSKRADELEQAVQQSLERDEFVAEHPEVDLVAEPEAERTEHLKDEL